MLDENGESLGELLMYMAHTYFIDDSMRAKSLYEQAIVELSMTEETWCVELAICYCRLGCLQTRKQFFIRCFYLLTYVTDLSTLMRENLEETGECYFYLAKNYTQEDFIIDKSYAQQFCKQALRLFLNVQPPTSNFREMQDCVQLLLTLQENSGKISVYKMCSVLFHSFSTDETENIQTTTKNELLQMIYDESPITEEQLKDMLDQTLSILNNKDTKVELITEETIDQNSE